MELYATITHITNTNLTIKRNLLLRNHKTPGNIYYIKH